MRAGVAEAREDVAPGDQVGDGPQVAALVAYESFVEGANEIEVYVIP